MSMHVELSPEERTKTDAEYYLAEALRVIDVQDAKIELQVGDISNLAPTPDHLACTMHSPDYKEFIIAVDPKAQGDLRKILFHEVVHVAHTARYGDDDGEAMEWLVDQVALLSMHIQDQTKP